MKKILIIIFLWLFILPAFAEFYPDYAKSEYYFIISDGIHAKFETAIKNKDINIDYAFYTMQKEYEIYTEVMNTYNIDDISELQCDMENDIYNPRTDNRSNKIDLKEYYKHGYILKCSEGMSYFDVDYKFLLDKYGSKLSDTYKEYLNYKLNAIKFDDVTPCSTEKEFLAEIKYLKKFIKEHPDFIGISDVMSRLDFMKEFHKSYRFWKNHK